MSLQKTTTPSEEGAEPRRLTNFKKLMASAAVGLLALDAFFDFYLVPPGGAPRLQWVLLATAVIGITMLQGVWIGLITRGEGNQPRTKEIDINQGILTQWNEVRNSLGLDADEPRANITQFPAELAQIDELFLARQRLSGRGHRVTRRKLTRRITTIMHEALDPLATELRYAKHFAAEADRIVGEADTSLRQSLAAINTTAARRAAQAHAEQLLRTT